MPNLASSVDAIVERCRSQYPTALWQTWGEWAGQTIRSSAWARAYYQMLIEQGKRHNAAIRSLAYKWGRIVFSCWQTIAFTMKLNISRY